MSAIERGCWNVVESSKRLAKPAQRNPHADLFSEIPNQAGALAGRALEQSWKLSADAVGFGIKTGVNGCRFAIGSLLAMGFKAVKSLPIIPIPK